jgi:hypothetical protein
VAGFRYFHVYGPRESHKGRMASVAFHFFNQLLKDGRVRLFEGCDGYGPGEQVRDFVSVEDVVRVNLFFLDHPEISGIFNVGTGRAQCFNDVAVATVNAIRRARGEAPLALAGLREPLGTSRSRRSGGQVQSFTQIRDAPGRGIRRALPHRRGGRVAIRRRSLRPRGRPVTRLAFAAIGCLAAACTAPGPAVLSDPMAWPKAAIPAATTAPVIGNAGFESDFAGGRLSAEWGCSVRTDGVLRFAPDATTSRRPACSGARRKGPRRRSQSFKAEGLRGQRALLDRGARAGRRGDGAVPAAGRPRQCWTTSAAARRNTGSWQRHDRDPRAGRRRASFGGRYARGGSRAGSTTRLELRARRPGGGFPRKSNIINGFNRPCQGHWVAREVGWT